MGDMKLPKLRRKKDTTSESPDGDAALVMTTPSKSKKGRATDDVISASAMAAGEAPTNGHGTNAAEAPTNGHGTNERFSSRGASTDGHDGDAEQRRRWIAEAAYFRALRRNFSNGSPETDWLEAEAEVVGRRDRA